MADELISRQTAKLAVMRAGCIGNILPLLDAEPAVDAVEVVRCKDCKHQELCVKQLVFWERDHVLEQNVYKYHDLDFCSYGERRADDAAD